MYLLLIRNNIVSNGQKKWEEILTLGLDEAKWREIFKLSFIVTQNTKLQWLQYRINQRILGTNTFLYKIKVKDNAFCTFCQEDEETIEHLFWNCESVQASIDEIDSWLLSNGVSIPFTMLFFLFGDTSKSSRGDAINLILLQIKQYIFNCKYFQKKLSLVTMQRKIQSLYNIEKSIAIMECFHFTV